MAPTLQLRTLGRLDLRDRAGAPSPVLARPKDLSVLVFLAVAEPRGFHRRDTLLAHLWPEADQRHARGALSQVLYRLRQDLGAKAIRSRGQEAVGVSERVMKVDVRTFEDRLRRGAREDALRLYRGPLLEGFHLPGSGGWERWLDARREALRRQAIAAAIELAEEQDGTDQPQRTARWLRKALDLSPLDERILRLLLRTLSQAGDPAAAIGAYERFARRMRREYELEPAAETQALVRSIRGGEMATPGAGHAPAEALLRGPESGASSRSRILSLRPSPAPIRSLAVLPLETRSDSQDATIFADGIADVLIGALGRIGALRVISKQTTERYRGVQARLDEIGDRLGVDGLITGSIDRTENRLHIRVRLIRVRPEEQLWDQTYTCAVADVAAVHGEIAREIARAVQVRLTEEERRRLSTERPVDPEAYQAYLKGRHFALIPGAVERALEYFRTAVRQDPAYAPPYAGMAITYCNLALYAYLDPEVAGQSAKEAVTQALALDAGSSEAHAARGLTLGLFDHDWSEAEQEFRHALRLNPSSALAWSYLGGFLASMGCFAEALAAARESTTLDPTGPWTGFVSAWTAYRSRQLESAVEQFRETIDLDPRVAICHGFLAAALSLLGQDERAVHQVELGLEKAPTDQIILGYGTSVIGRAGRREDACALLVRLERMRPERYVDPFYLAVARLGAGDRGGALDILEGGVAGSAPALFLKTDPLFDPLRGDSRFHEVVERLAFPD